MLGGTLTAAVEYRTQPLIVLSTHEHVSELIMSYDKVRVRTINI